MPYPWIQSIRDGGQLSVHIDRNAGGGWTNVTQRAVREFNELSRRGRLGVTFTLTSETDANVVVRTLSGQGSFSYDGATHEVNVPARQLTGHTSLVRSAGASSQVEKAFVFLPTQVQINTPRGQRPVGDGVRLVIAAHELVHATGLTNDDHSTEGLFQANPPADAGSGPGGDRVRRTGATGSGYMPPLMLAADAQRKIKSVW
jgi:hypothetical protein